MMEAKVRSQATYKPRRLKSAKAEMVDFRSRYSVKEKATIEQEDASDTVSRMESIKGRKLSPHADGDVQITLGNWSEYSNQSARKKKEDEPAPSSSKYQAARRKNKNEIKPVSQVKQQLKAVQSQINMDPKMSKNLLCSKATSKSQAKVAQPVLQSQKSTINLLQNKSHTKSREKVSNNKNKKVKIQKLKQHTRNNSECYGGTGEMRQQLNNADESNDSCNKFVLTFSKGDKDVSVSQNTSIGAKKVLYAEMLRHSNDNQQIGGKVQSHPRLRQALGMRASSVQAYTEMVDRRISNVSSINSNRDLDTLVDQSHRTSTESLYRQIRVKRSQGDASSLLTPPVKNRRTTSQVLSQERDPIEKSASIDDLVKASIKKIGRKKREQQRVEQEKIAETKKRRRAIEQKNKEIRQLNFQKYMELKNKRQAVDSNKRSKVDKSEKLQNAQKQYEKALKENISLQIKEKQDDRRISGNKSQEKILKAVPLAPPTQKQPRFRDMPLQVVKSHQSISPVTQERHPDRRHVQSIAEEQQKPSKRALHQNTKDKKKDIGLEYKQIRKELSRVISYQSKRKKVSAENEALNQQVSLPNFKSIPISNATPTPNLFSHRTCNQAVTDRKGLDDDKLKKSKSDLIMQQRKDRERKQKELKIQQKIESQRVMNNLLALENQTRILQVQAKRKAVQMQSNNRFAKAIAQSKKGQLRVELGGRLSKYQNNLAPQRRPEIVHEILKQSQVVEDPELDVKTIVSAPLNNDQNPKDASEKTSLQPKASPRVELVSTKTVPRDRTHKEDEKHDKNQIKSVNEQSEIKSKTASIVAKTKKASQVTKRSRERSTTPKAVRKDQLTNMPRLKLQESLATPEQQPRQKDGGQVETQGDLPRSASSYRKSKGAVKKRKQPRAKQIKGVPHLENFQNVAKLSQEDLVIYMILTQAATMIQRAFRRFINRDQRCKKGSPQKDGYKYSKKLFRRRHTFSFGLNDGDEKQQMPKELIPQIKQSQNHQKVSEDYNYFMNLPLQMEAGESSGTNQKITSVSQGQIDVKEEYPAPLLIHASPEPRQQLSNEGSSFRNSLATDENFSPVVTSQDPSNAILQAGVSTSKDPIPEDSMLASAALKTDKIINYSAAMNTSEELIEQAVNSNTLESVNIFPRMKIDKSLEVVNPAQVKDKIELLRCVSGDEKFLLNYSKEISNVSVEQSFTENPQFLNTNGSIFDRNPFNDFTKSKIADLLQNKHDIKEIIQMKEEAIKYGETVEKQYIARQERAEQLSPRSIQQKKYELEKWVNAERDPVSNGSPSNTPRAPKSLEHERMQVLTLIEKVNTKVKNIKEEISKPKLATQESFGLPIPSLPSNSCSQEVSIIDQDAGVTSEEPVKKPEVVELEISIEVDEDSQESKEKLQPEQEVNLTDALTNMILEELLGDVVQLEKLCSRSDQKHSPRGIVDLETYQSNEGEKIMAGVDTTIEAVEIYIDSVLAQIKSRSDQFMQAFYTPIYHNPLLILQNLQAQQIGQGNLDPLNLSNTLASILNVQLYLTLENARENVIREALKEVKEQAKNAQSLEDDENLSELLSESDHIHNKAIFDAVNEALNLARPYGTLGEPMPWSNRPRRNFFVFIDDEQVEQLLNGVKDQVLEWARTKAGQFTGPTLTEPLMVKDQSDVSLKEGQKDPSVPSKVTESGLIRQAKFAQISEEEMILNRETSLQKLLGADLIQSEKQWLDYELEEAQVKLDLSDMLLEHLVVEVLDQLRSLDNRTFDEADSFN